MLATPSLHPICRTTNGSRWVSECLGSGRRGSAEARRACISGPSSALRARRWRSWLWAVPRQLRAGEERLRLCGRWAQLLARRSPAGRCRRLPACSRKERCGSPVSRGGGRRNTVAGDSFYDRSPSETFRSSARLSKKQRIISIGPRSLWRVAFRRPAGGLGNGWHGSRGSPDYSLILTNRTTLQAVLRQWCNHLPTRQVLRWVSSLCYTFAPGVAASDT
jgi:hypothetical protein